MKRVKRKLVSRPERSGTTTKRGRRRATPSSHCRRRGGGGGGTGQGWETGQGGGAGDPSWRPVYNYCVPLFRYTRARAPFVIVYTRRIFVAAARAFRTASSRTFSQCVFHQTSVNARSRGGRLLLYGVILYYYNRDRRALLCRGRKRKPRAPLERIVIFFFFIIINA